jgi:hypothetical protein
MSEYADIWAGCEWLVSGWWNGRDRKLSSVVRSLMTESEVFMRRKKLQVRVGKEELANAGRVTKWADRPMTAPAVDHWNHLMPHYTMIGMIE